MKTLYITLGLLLIVYAGSIAVITKRNYKSLPQPMKVLGIYFAIDVLFSVTEYVLLKFGIHNLFMTNIQLPITFTGYTLALSYWVSNVRMKKIFFYAIPAYFLTCVILFLTIEDFFKFSSISLPISITIVLLFSVYVLVTILKDTSTPVTSQPRFWISSGLIIYTGGNATFFLMLQLFVSGSIEALKLATIYHNIIGNIAYMLFLVAFLRQQKILKSSTFTS